jgi:hypothetical protein
MIHTPAVLPDYLFRQGKRKPDPFRTVESVRELQKIEQGTWVRNHGLLYFHQLEDGGIVPHVVSTLTNGERRLAPYHGQTKKDLPTQTHHQCRTRISRKHKNPIPLNMTAAIGEGSKSIGIK